jgi:tripartite-type tricarboxylate transporter receptor subunit TctC
MTRARTRTMRTLLLHALCVALLMPAGTAAQPYPQRPVRLIVPHAEGSIEDVLARTIAGRLSNALGQTVVTDNRPGASTILGFELQARAAPDGHTLLMGGFDGLVLNPLLHKKLPYSVDRDIAPVVLVGTAPLMVVVHPAVPARALKDLVEYARANPGKLRFASAGNGNITHIAGELFMTMTNTRMQHVPYKGGASSMQDQLTGAIGLKFDTPVAALPLIKSGRLRALAVTSQKRLGTLPDVPTVSESGFPTYEAAIWSGIVGRKGTPEPVINRLNKEIVRILQAPDLRAQFAALAIEPGGGTPSDLAVLVRKDTARWGAVIRKAGIAITP